MQYGTFAEMVGNHPEAFGQDPATGKPLPGNMGAYGLWKASIDDERLSIRAAAYRLKDLKDMQPTHEGSGKAFSADQLAAVGYNVGPGLMNDVASGRYPSKYGTSQPMGPAAQHYLDGYNAWWGTANEWICTNGVVVC